MEEDRAVIARIKNGDTGAFAVLVQKYQGRLLTFIHRMVRDGKIVEDIGQEVFLDVYKSLRNFDETRGTPFSAWLFIAARNRCVNELRKRTGEHCVHIDAVDAADLGVDLRTAEHLLLEHERRSALRDSLAKISEPLRKPIFMWLNGGSLAEIAEACGVSPGTVKSRLFRAREKVRVCVQHQAGGKNHDGV
ncbi:RNA polymerase sigma factor [Syntrophobacter fumaroxidans]|uniref:RNA polymerase, sigma-24 subunit, ECF subfamily n=1 Tax=Syntrophobacter fumaroxidans (strain DSM 10017 / MPOB) TaxID=335543 RepID=A0LFU6_SYNFM|nr:sigma-70 family RNA polymerase sigma factor [Syntrophobacter fumaroxidans]ABK16298.1 RNA polymerase, sigma-24 subunit, ECF subfamily [Syntrophobacter fumaroxidans MPOB]